MSCFVHRWIDPGPNRFSSSRWDLKTPGPGGYGYDLDMIWRIYRQSVSNFVAILRGKEDR
jgi:hypothetical protein